MLTIRLSRIGRVHTPIYRIVVTQHTEPVKGKFIEILGVYENHRIPKKLKLDLERYEYWVSKGAKPSETVNSLVSTHAEKGAKQIDKAITKKRLPKKDKKEAS